jgi:hypothetical protein
MGKVQDEILNEFKASLEGGGSEPAKSESRPRSEQAAILEEFASSMGVRPAPRKQAAAPTATDRARRDAVTPYPGITDTIESVGNFINENIDKPTRRFFGAPETGEAFAKKMGIGSDTVLGVPKDKAAAMAYDVAASPLNLLPLAPKALGLAGKGMGAMAGRLTKTAENIRNSPVGVADTLVTAVPALAAALVGTGASPGKVAAGVLTGLAAAAARKYAVPPAATAGASVLTRVSQALGPQFQGAIKSATKAGVPAAQMAKLVETSEGIKTLKTLLGGQREQEPGLIGRLKKRNPSR